MAFATWFWGEQPDHAIVGERCDRIYEQIDEVFVFVTKPHEADIDDICEVIVNESRSAGSDECVSDLLRTVIVIADFLNDRTVGNSKT
jgi:hypothetical protein